MKIPSAGILGALRESKLFITTCGELPVEFSGISDDTRTIEAGALFLAVKGAERDGHDFLADAAKRGAVAAIVEDPARTTLPAIVVQDGRLAAARAASAAYGFPARQLRFIGVTGTNGKSTTVAIVRHLLDSPGSPAASIGTLGVFVSEDRPLPGGGGLTTPGPVELQRLLRQLVDRGVKTVAMEVSSHSLDQRRVDGVTFDAAIFTNLTRDHLDYHGTMEAYFAAKARLVSLLSGTGVSVVNADAPVWRRLPKAPRTITYGIDHASDVAASDVSLSARGSSWTLASGGERAAVKFSLVGEVNVYNGLAAAAAAIALGQRVRDVATGLSGVSQTPGRLERIAENPLVIRDYAHTPDALERVLTIARQLATGRVILVFGCGGERDRGKRPIMGGIAERLADLAIVTSDNPRTEDPDRIIDEIERGMQRGNHERITDRRTAIERALALAEPRDVVILAGKGHETYQIRGTEKFPFDERRIVEEIRSAMRG